MKDFKKKIELCGFAFITYVKTLKLRFFLGGVSFDKEKCLDKLKTADHIIIGVFIGWCFWAIVREVVYLWLIIY